MYLHLRVRVRESAKVKDLGIDYYLCTVLDAHAICMLFCAGHVSHIYAFHLRRLGFKRPQDEMNRFACVESSYWKRQKQFLPALTYRAHI